MGLLDTLFFGEERRKKTFRDRFAAAQNSAGIAAIGPRGALVETPDNRISSFLAADVVNDLTGAVPRRMGVRLDPNRSLIAFKNPEEGRAILDVLTRDGIRASTPISKTLSSLLGDDRTAGSDLTKRLLEDMEKLRAKNSSDPKSLPTTRFLQNWFTGPTEGSNGYKY